MTRVTVLGLRAALRLRAGTPHTFRLPPFEVLVFQALPAPLDEPPSADKNEH